jgi:hypothetical protein
MKPDEILKKVNSKQWYHTIEVAPGVFTPGRYNPAKILDTMGFPKDFTPQQAAGNVPLRKYSRKKT